MFDDLRLAMDKVGCDFAPGQGLTNGQAVEG